MPSSNICDYYEINFEWLHRNKYNPNAQIHQWLIDQSISEHEIVTTTYRSKTKLSVFFKSISSAHRLLKQYTSQPIKNVTARQISLPKESWFDKWKTSYRPSNIGKKLKVIPAWQSTSKNMSDSKRLSILIDPGAAFGSGTHETTALLLKVMQEYSFSQKSVLDVGTGTGILAIAAKKLGAVEVTGIDNDPSSIKAAKNNFKLNHVKGKLHLSQAETHQDQKQYDIVLANMISKELESAHSFLIKHMKPKAILLVSGILQKNFQEFDKIFLGKTLRRKHAWKGRSWMAAAYQKI